MRLLPMLALGLVLTRDSQADEVPEVLVGAARVDITPDGPIRLSGYLVREVESRGVAQRIGAKALAIGDGPGAALIISVDNVGVPGSIVSTLAERLMDRAGISRERIAVGSSHTHSAPCLTGAIPNLFGKPIPADQQSRIDIYSRGLVDKLERVCLDALANRKPARLAWARGSLGFAANRRTPGGPVDHDLPVLKATAPDGTLRAVVTNYACHCVTLPPNENLVDGDWAGYAQAAIEADHPGCVALTLIGCGADANPARRLAPGAAVDHGRALADEVNRLLMGAWTDLPAPTEFDLERLSLPFDTLPTREKLEALAKAGGPSGYNASTWLARLDKGESLPSSLPYSAQAWRFGDRLLMTFLPGEVVVDYALRLKKEFDSSRLWVTAYANDVPCYIPSERVLREGGYEAGDAMAYYGHPIRLKPGVEGLIINAVHKAAGPGFERPVPKDADDATPAPLSPAEGVQAFRAKPGLRVELVACEPLVESPVAVDFGADGRLWVCEMRDYPMGLDNHWKPGGAIKVLEDRDRDGRYETATTFLDGLPFPTGVMAWREGVLICAAPELLYAEDTDGDGKADLRRVLYQGFATENYQARVNGLSYGLDNWVYGANGLIGGKIRGTANGREVDIGGRDFRFRPDTGEFEPASGLTQQGRVRDDWGDSFGGNNGILIQHYPLPDHDARRNPRVAAPSPAVVLAQGDDSSRVFPASRTLARYNQPESANHVTSACSPVIYRDTFLGPEFVGNAFICEPVHNLISRLVLEPSGATFAGRRAGDERDREFLASTDPWCRPVQVRTGPDGALWVVDLYRFVIEHPRWISPERLAGLDVRAGADKGRIYRIVPVDSPVRPVPRLDQLSTRDLAAALDSPNGTLRDNVHRLLTHRGERSAAPTLVEVARASQHPAARAQALGALDGLGALETASLLAALSDPHPGVRREAARLAAPRLASDAAIRPALLTLADDPEITVRFEVALTLGDWPAPEAGQALGRIAVRDGEDPWVRAAVLSSATPHAGAILTKVLAAAGPGGPSSSLVEPLIATATASGDRRALAGLLDGAALARPEPWRLGAIAALLDGPLAGVLDDDPSIRSAIASARVMAADASAEPGGRIAAIRLLGRSRGNQEADRDVLSARLAPAEPVEVQLSAIGGLMRLGDSGSASALVARWARLGPAARAVALDALLAREETTETLLKALEQGTIPLAQIDAAHREQLLRHGPDARRQRASAVFGPLAIGPRKAVLDAYAGAKTLPGEPSRGRVIFEKACASCHKLGGIGHEIGPDLAALTDTSADALLTAILDPNREVDARYAVYSAATKDGRVLTGLIAAETASALTLKRQEGQTDSILRADLEEVTTSGHSLMPEGLENDLKPADLADVIAFVARSPKVLPGNQPRTVAPSPDGTIRMEASTAEILGPSLTYETEFGNLGYWRSNTDQATWTFHVDQPLTYTVSLDWACDDSVAGNSFRLRIDDQEERGTVAGTGGWSVYRTVTLREIPLEPGDHRLELRPAGPIRGALADVRSISLRPPNAQPRP